MTFSLRHNPLSSLRRATRDESGVVVVEFAFVALLLMLIVFGIVDFGRAFNYWIDETHLASEAARYAAVDQNPGASSNTSLLAWVRAQADSAELKTGSSSVTTPLQLCVSFPNGTHNVGDPVRVEATTTYKFMSLFGGVSKQVAVNSTMRLERVPTNYADGDCS